MSKTKSPIKENSYIQFNSLVTFSVLQKENENSKYAKYLTTEENLVHSLNFKLCKKPLLEYSDLKGSLFYIRKIDECISNYGVSENDTRKIYKKEENAARELRFINKDYIHQNSQFYLQHLASKKFISIERTEDNKLVIKLLKSIDKAATFLLRKINTKKYSKDFLSINEIFYLTLYIKEDAQYIYIQSGKNSINKNNTKYYNIIMGNNPITQFYLIDQNWYIKDSKSIYSGQLINIIFSYTKDNREEQFMLGVEKKEIKNDFIDDENKINSNIIDYRIIDVPYSNELYDHILNNSFWVIEEKLNINDINKKPIQTKNHIRIKNISTGLYLYIRMIGNINNSDSNSEEMSFLFQNKTFQFILVDENELNHNFYFEYNFIFFNYMLDSSHSEIIDNGKYLLKGVVKKFNINHISESDYYYQSISLTINKKNNLIVKVDDDFIFKIEKMDLNLGNQAIYVKKIITILEQEINKNNLNNNNIVNDSITFFLEYLLNIDYSFRDENYEYNVPIRERQNLLLKFNIVETIANIIDYYLKKIDDEGEIFLTDEIKVIINDFLSNIIKFFKFLSVDNEEIKQTIYIIALNKLLKFAELIFNNEDITILINFIFDLIDDSEALQDYLLGGGGLLKQQILNNKKLSKYNINKLLREKKLLEYIEKNHNYLLCYEKLIELNKVQYKRKEIISHVKNHMNEVKNKKKPFIKNYKRMIDDLVAEVIMLIRKHAILLDRFRQVDEKSLLGIYAESLKKKKIEKKYGRRNSVKMNLIRKSNEDVIRDKRSRINNIIGSSLLLDTTKNNSLRPFLESTKNVNINILNDDIPKKDKILNLKTLNIRSSLKPLDNDNNNNSNRNILITTESSESGRLIKESSPKNEKSKVHFSKNDDIQNIESKNATKFYNSNLSSAILKRKTKRIEKIKTIGTNSPLDSKETVRSENAESYQRYLNKLGKICIFIKFFITFDLDNSLFIQDNFFNDIFKSELRLEEFKNQLYIFFVGKTDAPGTKFTSNEQNITILYLFHLYNMLFPSVKSKLKKKIKENRPITGKDLLEELKDYNDDNNYTNIDDETKYKQDLELDFEVMDECLCILYSVYQFCINQYAKTVYELSIIITNYFMNFVKNEILNQFKNIFTETIKILLSKVVFMDNEFMEKLYHKSMINPSLLNKEFDFDNLFPEPDESKNKNKNKNKIQQFSSKESMLIEYLFFFVKKCDQIKYLYEKIVIYKYIKELINDEELRKKLKEEYNSKVEEQLLNILKILNNKKLKILILYEKLINLNTKYSLEQNQNIREEKNITETNMNEEEGENDKFLVFKVSKRTEIIIKLLRKYELEKFFNNIIYLESKESFFISDKIIKKVRNLRDQFTQIEKEILIIRINWGKNIYLKESDKKIIDNEESNKDSFMSLIRHLSQICSDSGKLFNMDTIIYKRKDILCKMLSMENKTFYEKMKFNKSFKYMIDAISYFKGKKDQNILIYCSYLLKIFNDMKNIDNNFHKNIAGFYKIYGLLLLKSLKCISEFPKDSIGEKEQNLFLNICYYGISAFLLIIKNCKLTFHQMKDFMENIFEELQIIFNQFNGKNKIIYQILYTYTITRLLLFLNKKRTYDSYSYDMFFKFIYPKDKMKENISFCVDTININSNKEHIIYKKNTNIFSNENTYIEENEDSISISIPDDEKDPLIIHDLKVKVVPMDLSNINIKLPESKNSQEKTNFQKEKFLTEDFIRWDDFDEISRLSFYLNFLSIYVIYLNDKNSLLRDEDEFSKRELINKEEFSYNSLYTRIKELLDYDYDNYSKINEGTNIYISSQVETTLIKEEKLYFKDYLGIKNMDYKFYSVLLESILSYRAKCDGNNIEIPIKKVKFKKDENNHEIQKTKTQDTLLIGKNNDKIIFYYYDPEYIDIILLEKIINSIELREDLMDYCLEEYHYEKNIPPLLESLLKSKKSYKIIENYYDEEYNLIHNHFIKNNMESLIKKILNSFNSNDFNEIESMENYLFKKMGEIYSDYYTKIDKNIEKKISLVEYLSKKEENLEKDLNRINLLTFLDSLVYIYPKYSKSIGIIYYKIGFKLLMDKSQNYILSKDDKENNSKSNEKVDLESITKILILLFSRKTNRELIEEKNVFRLMLNSIRVYFSFILLKGGGFILKNVELLKEIFHKMDFVFENLSKDFENISEFMKKPNNLKDIDKYIKKKDRLVNLLNFLIMFLEFKEVTEENLLTEEIFKFICEIVEKVIKLIFILLEMPQGRNTEIIDILINFLFNFIKGPDIENLNKLFSLGFFNLLKYIIKNIDYYKLFLNYLNKDNMHEVIDNSIEIECKIIKIFIVYYNETYNTYNIEEFEKIQLWYKENFKYIRKKLKRLYYMSQKEMEKRDFDINKMLLFIKSNDNYNEFELKIRGGIISKASEKTSFFQINKEKENSKEKNQNIENKNINDNKNFCIIKFDILLAYYTLYNYHKDIANKECDYALRMMKRKNKKTFYRIIIFFNDLFMFFINFFLYLYFFISYCFKKVSFKNKKEVDLLQDLTNIDEKSKLIDDQKMINFLRLYIRELEVSIKNNIYKIYFPMLDKSNTIELYKEEYYKVEEISSSDFMNYLLTNYDKINIRANQYIMINKIFQLPFMNFIFRKIYIFAVLLITFGLASNFLIMISYSTFNDKCKENDNKAYEPREIRLKCPHFLYNINYKTDSILLALKIFGIIELVLQLLIFFDYIIRIVSVEHAICKLNCKLERLKQSKEIEDGKIDFFSFAYEIILKTIFKCIINFRSFYYILSIVFIILGLKVHPFFNCITLLEFVNRIQLMQTVLKAMYKPLKSILITLLMFIILEYFFSLFAISYFATHFPNETDTKNFLKTFMRMMDQTFKQDGGIGTYLNKALDEGYIQYSTTAYFNVRFFFDLLFFLLILLLIFQMFLSTIIDYFNDIRENTEKFKEGLETQCTVCFMKREKIEKLYSHDKNAFDNHINLYHNTFNYIYYLMYLQSSSIKDIIIERTIWDLHLKKDLSFLPKNTCFKKLEKNCWEKLNQRKNEEEEE